MIVRDKKKKNKAVLAKKTQATGETRTRASRRQTAVFLDRDGTLNQEVGYINHIDRLRLYPWSAEAIRKLNRAGVPVIVLTNQSGVGRGYFSEELVHRVHQKIALELAASEAHLDPFYYCPHHPDSDQAAYKKKCQCRKPLAGMVDEAAKKFHIDVKSSYVVGDSTRDMEMGINAGARTVLVMTGYGRGNYENLRGDWPRQPDLIAENLLEAVEKILGELARRAIKPQRRDGALRTS